MIPLVELMRLFSQLSARNQPVLLLNTYRGVPVSHEARVISIHKGYVVFGVHPEQAACLSLEEKTYVQSELLPEVYNAHVVAVDLAKNQSILTEFTGAGTSLGKRMTVRVQPQEPIEVELYDGEHRVPGQLVDISSTGMGIFTVATYIYSDLSFDKGTKVYIDFRLPVTDDFVRLQGRINSVAHQQGTFLHRLGLSILPNPDAEPMLKRYVDLRQQEILDELQRVSASMRQESSLKS